MCCARRRTARAAQLRVLMPQRMTRRAAACCTPFSSSAPPSASSPGCSPPWRWAPRSFFQASCDVPHVHTRNEQSTWLHDQFSCQDLRITPTGDGGVGSVLHARMAVVASANAEVAGAHTRHAAAVCSAAASHFACSDCVFATCWMHVSMISDQLTTAAFCIFAADSQACNTSRF